jgi:hypothetical protein
LGGGEYREVGKAIYVHKNNSSWNTCVYLLNGIAELVISLENYTIVQHLKSKDEKRYLSKSVYLREKHEEK